MVRWLGWAWRNGASACRSCIEARRAPEMFEGSGYRVTIYDAHPNWSGQCSACGATMTGENCWVEEEPEVSDEIQVAAEVKTQLAREVIARVQWTHPEAMQKVAAWQICDDAQQEFAAQLLREVKAEWEIVEAERKKITKPLADVKKATDALFKPVLRALEDVEARLKEKIAGYMQAKQQANVAALQAAASAPTALAAAQQANFYEPVQAPQGVSVRQVWKFEVTDPSAVPRELCSPDMQKIAAALQAKTDKYGQPDLIPGVRVFQEAQVTSRKA